MADLMLDNVSKRFGERAAVHGLSLSIGRGEFVALLGPSGCGKSTTLRLLAGFETLTAGAISLGGRRLADATRHEPPERRNMAMVFQSYALWPHMSVADNVGYPLKLRRVKGPDYRARVRRALETVELSELAERRPEALSGGQRQRVALARCLVTEPAVVLLDEPLANLDRHLRSAMEEHFRVFHQRTGATMLYVTHDQAEAMSLADRIAVMHDGELAQWTTPQALYRQPRSEWVARFIGQGSILHLPGGQAGEVLGRETLMQLAATEKAGVATPVLVRPEHVRLGTDGMTARVERCIFRGERYEVSLRLVTGAELFAYHSQALAPGADVGVVLEQGWGLERAA
ncbi:ABC transporter ATP-binding protein [Arhodomonas sp. AD133]|uniref:ABC transporter ATP-binding protein n=1 Tax=Arhodomonas sp. AD133 TaxID=3415009 RepID=UPI003EBACD93